MTSPMRTNNSELPRISVSPATHAALRAAALADGGRSVSSIVRAAIQRELERRQPEVEQRAA